MKHSIITLLGVLVLIAVPVFSQQNGDVNCDESVNIFDVTGLISYLYMEGPAPCDFISPGVAYSHYDSQVVDVGYSYDDLIWVGINAPDDGWVSLSFSFYVATEAYCMQFSLSDSQRDQSVIWSYTVDSPNSWTQIFPCDSGITYYSLDVKSCARDKEKYSVTFKNVNLSATYFPANYGITRK